MALQELRGRAEVELGVVGVLLLRPERRRERELDAAGRAGRHGAGQQVELLVRTHRKGIRDSHDRLNEILHHQRGRVPQSLGPHPLDPVLPRLPLLHGLRMAARSLSVQIAVCLWLPTRLASSFGFTERWSRAAAWNGTVAAATQTQALAPGAARAERPASRLHPEQIPDEHRRHDHVADAVAEERAEDADGKENLDAVQNPENEPGRHDQEAGLQGTAETAAAGACASAAASGGWAASGPSRRRWRRPSTEAGLNCCRVIPPT